MTTATIRKKVISYMADVEDKKIKAIYSLLENEIENQEDFKLSKTELAILEKDQKEHVAGISKSYSWNEAKKMIRE